MAAARAGRDTAHPSWAREVAILAQARDVDGQFGLVVRLEDGETTTLRTGEVSVRGLYGYTE